MDFGYKLVDGAPGALYIFDHTQSQETNVHLPVLGGVPTSTTRVAR